MYKNTVAFFYSFIILATFVKHERPGAIGMSKAGVRVSGVAR